MRSGLQRWAERRRRILVVVPASLRRQWAQELEEKFFLPTLLLDAVSEKRLRAERLLNPFLLNDRIAICSYQFAAARQELVAVVGWDLIVVDEAHRLRNVYKAGNKTARALVAALEGRPKLLLTATPRQNSLMELYGLVSIVDPHIFGDPTTFRDQFVRAPEEGARDRLLRLRLADVCQRTLRRQVLEYVRFTRRIPPGSVRGRWLSVRAQVTTTRSSTARSCSFVIKAQLGRRGARAAVEGGGRGHGSPARGANAAGDADARAARPG